MDRNKAFPKVALRSALNGLLIYIWNRFSGIKKSFEDAIIKVAWVLKLLVIIASAVARDTAAIAPTARYAAKIVKQEMEKSVKDLALTPPKLLPCGSDLALNKGKSHEDRSPEKESSRRKPSVLSSDKGT